MSKKSVDDAIGTILEKYSDNTHIRLAVRTLIPYLGDGLDFVFSEGAAKIRAERLNLLLSELEKRLTEIEESKIDKEFLASEEFYEIFTKTMDTAIRTYRKEKIAYLALFLKNSVKKENSETYYKERVLRIIDELSPIHIQILKTIFDIQYNEHDDPTLENIRTPVSNNDLMKDFPDLKRSQIESFANDLIRYNLLADWGIGRMDYTAGRYMITAATAEFLSFVSD